MLKLAPLQVSTSPPSNRRAYPLHTSQSSLLICMRGLDAETGNRATEKSLAPRVTLYKRRVLFYRLHATGRWVTQPNSFSITEVFFDQLRIG